MRRVSLLLAALATIGFAPGAPPGAAAAYSPPYPANLTVEHGEPGWHVSPELWLSWESSATLTPTHVEHRVRSLIGSVAVPLTRRALGGDSGLKVRLPDEPGHYTAELRLFDGVAWGPWAEAWLRFDDSRPPPVGLSVGEGWVPAGPLQVALRTPAGPRPVSGISGYAVSVDGDPEGAPCVARVRCRDSELDLHGAGGGAVSLPNPGEGRHYVHAVAVSGAGLASSAVASAPLRVDGTLPDVSLHGAPAGWANHPVAVLATATDRLSGTRPDGQLGPFTAISVDGGVPVAAPGGQVGATVTGDGIHSVAFYARDAAGNVADGQGGSPQPRRAAVRIDTAPPRVAFVAGPDPADPERILARVADPLSGPAPRGSIAVRRVGAKGPFEPLRTAAGGGWLVARWDSEAVPFDTYEFRVSGYDRAGNAASSSHRADGARMVLPSRLRKRVVLRFGFGGRKMTWQRCRERGSRRKCRREETRALDRRPSRRMLRLGRRVPVFGTLTRPGGAPLAGRPVAVVETLASGARRSTALRTRADGSFFTRLAPGPTRLIEARFAGDRLLARARGKRLRLAVRSGVRLRASASSAAIGGAPVRFRGRVATTDAAIPPEGVSVELQFRLPGTPWSEFRTVRTDRRGRFHYAYAFTDNDSRGARFLFRAHVPAQAVWPYAAGSSLPAAVTGR